jgi:hypothetical protein
MLKWWVITIFTHDSTWWVQKFILLALTFNSSDTFTKEFGGSINAAHHHQVHLLWEDPTTQCSKHQLTTSLQLFSATPQVHISLGTHLPSTHPSFLSWDPKLKWNTQDLAKLGLIQTRKGLMRALSFSDLIFRRPEDFPTGEDFFHFGRSLLSSCAWQWSSKIHYKN